MGTPYICDKAKICLPMIAAAQAGDSIYRGMDNVVNTCACVLCHMDSISIGRIGTFQLDISVEIL